MWAILENSRVLAGPIPIEGVAIPEGWIEIIPRIRRPVLGFTKTSRKRKEEEQHHHGHGLSHGWLKFACIKKVMFPRPRAYATTLEA